MKQFFSHLKKPPLFFIFFAFLILVLDGFLFLYWQHNTQLTSASAGHSKNTFNYKREEQLLKTSFERDDDLKTLYTRFVTDYAVYDESLVHSLAHVVGEELYKRNGMAGVAICDDSFSFGCYHGFFGFALQKEGDSVIARAETICKSDKASVTQINGCMHGLGHGVVITQGYTYEDLLRALKKCDLLSSTSRPPCYNGVFMEYNRRVPFAAYGQNLGIRAFEKDNPYEPCNRLPTPYKAECYVEQPAWWSVTVPGLIYKEKITYSGKLCNRLPERQYQSQCFAGIARSFPFEKILSNARSDIATYCNLMPSEEGKTNCIESGIKILLARGDKDVQKLCRYLPSSHQTSCSNIISTFACGELSAC